MPSLHTIPPCFLLLAHLPPANIPAVSAEVAAASHRAATQQSAPYNSVLEAAPGDNCATGEVGQLKAGVPPSMLNQLTLEMNAMKAHMEATDEKVAQMRKMLPTPNDESDDMQPWVDV